MLIIVIASLDLKVNIKSNTLYDYINTDVHIKNTIEYKTISFIKTRNEL